MDVAGEESASAAKPAARGGSTMWLNGWSLALFLVLIAVSVSAPPLTGTAEGNRPGNHEHEAGDHDGEAMEAQHQRMLAFRNAMRALSDALIFSNLKEARADADKLTEALKGYEQDVPHKNRDRLREFYEIYVRMDGETQRLQSALKSEDLPEAAAAYGKVLETCVACHRIFRD
jgi:hypothetical protein